jgi:hypothetical protein
LFCSESAGNPTGSGPELMRTPPSIFGAENGRWRRPTRDPQAAIQLLGAAFPIPLAGCVNFFLPRVSELHFAPK